MPRFESLHYANPLDLLRRFIPTPLKALFRVGSIHVTVRTNDITLLPVFPLEADLEALGVKGFEWRLIRDADSPGLLEAPLFITSGALTIVGMGPACLIGADREKRELLAFIGRAIDTRTHQNFLIPLFCELTSEVFSTSTTLPFAARNEASANA
jgi:hypothetical protein